MCVCVCGSEVVRKCQFTMVQLHKTVMEIIKSNWMMRLIDRHFFQSFKTQTKTNGANWKWKWWLLCEHFFFLLRGDWANCFFPLSLLKLLFAVISFIGKIKSEKVDVIASLMHSTICFRLQNSLFGYQNSQ